MPANRDGLRYCGLKNYGFIYKDMENCGEETFKCNVCKCIYFEHGFGITRLNKRYKSCIKCRARARESAARNKCIHNRRKSRCKECGDSQICIHNCDKTQCKDCGGSSFCIHNRQKSYCKECGGGSICIHNRIKSRCKECGGGSICVHNRQKPSCKECDPQGHLRSIVASRVRSAMRSNKAKGTLEYLGCDIENFKLHISEQFEQGMSWDNYGDWEIDHIVPIKYKNPTIEEVAERLHYTNTQPMWKSENLAKGNRFIGKLDPYESDFVKFEQKKSIVHPPSN
jgi:hypothetical protein